MAIATNLRSNWKKTAVICQPSAQIVEIAKVFVPCLSAHGRVGLKNEEWSRILVH